MGIVRLFCSAAVAASAVLAWGPASAQTASAECDRLAGDPAVPFEALDAAAAGAACLQALTESPTDAHILYQYARALEKSGDAAGAQRLYQWAAGQGYAAAQGALARLAAPGEAPAAEAALVAPTASLAASIGADPEAALAWVAGSIAPDAYAGVMRGAAGTLAAGAGSAADRALLLAAIIRAADPAAVLRFATCSLPPAETGTLAKAVLAARPPRPQPLLEAAAQFASEVRDPEVRRIAEGLGTIWTEATATVARQSEVLATALAANATAPVGVAATPQALREAVAAHVWLQWQRPEGWVDLDPTVSPPAAGATRCAAAAFGDDVPDAMVQTLRVRVMLEERDGGTLTTRAILDQAFPTADLARGGLSFMFAESVGLGSAVPEHAAPAAGLLAYTPLLRDGAGDHVGDSFALPAPLSIVSADESFSGLGGVISGAGAFGDAAATGVAAADVRVEGNVTAAWIDFAFAAPGGGVETQSSMIFDRIGFARRAAGDVAGPLDPLPEVDGEYQALGTVWSIGLDAGVPPADDEAAPAAGADPLATLLGELGKIRATYDAYHHALFAAAVGTDQPRLLAFRPGLSLVGWRPDADPAGLGRADLVMDVLSDPARLPPGRTGANDAVAWAVSGVVAERLAAGMNRMFPALVGVADVPPFVPIDVAAVFDGAEDQSIPLAWVASTADAATVSGSNEALARIGAHVAGGAVLLSPTRAVAIGDGTALGWWLLDPATGLLRDEFENGRHAEMVERPVTEQPARQSAPAYRSFGQRVACTVNRAVGVISFVLGVASNDPELMNAAWSAAKFEAKVGEAADKTRRAGQAAQNAAGQGGCGGPPI